jgi:diadenosine tetraphosphatase ApaH/serine/threonine PP2A family protein phosphatase
MAVYHSPGLWEHIQEVFAWMPIAAVVNDSYFCVHGGISESYPTIQSIAEIRRPIVHADAVIDFFWGDPTIISGYYAPSPRGFGHLYGSDAVDRFLAENGLLQIIRAHEVVPEGVKTLLDGRVVTVFSTSDGSWPDKNSIAMLQIFKSNPANPVAATVLPPSTAVLTRENVQWKPCCEPATASRRSISGSLTLRIGLMKAPSANSRKELLAGLGSSLGAVTKSNSLPSRSELSFGGSDFEDG